MPVACPGGSGGLVQGRASEERAQPRDACPAQREADGAAPCSEDRDRHQGHSEGLRDQAAHGPAGPVRSAGARRGSGDRPSLLEIVAPLLAARRALCASVEMLHGQVLAAVREDAACRRLMTVPGAGPITASSSLRPAGLRRWPSTPLPTIELIGSGPVSSVSERPMRSGRGLCRASSASCRPALAPSDRILGRTPRARTPVFLFVATLGHSRRVHVRAFPGERQEHWFEGMEGAFRAFGGVPEEVLLDNARALVLHHDPASREVVLNPKLHAFARHWGFRVRACAPYRARTKGKDERGVGYVKRNAVAGRSFETEARARATTTPPTPINLSGDANHRRPVTGTGSIRTLKATVVEAEAALAAARRRRTDHGRRRRSKALRQVHHGAVPSAPRARPRLRPRGDGTPRSVIDRIAAHPKDDDGADGVEGIGDLSSALVAPTRGGWGRCGGSGGGT